MYVTAPTRQLLPLHMSNSKPERGGGGGGPEYIEIQADRANLGVDVYSLEQEVVDTGGPDGVPHRHLLLGHQLSHPAGQGSRKGCPLRQGPLVQQPQRLQAMSRE